jgi:hypothetical protein
MKNDWNIWFLDSFLTEKCVDSVHEPWTMTGGSVHHGPPGGVDWRPSERGGVLIGVWPPAAPGLGSSPARVGRGEGRTVKAARRSPRLETRRDGRVTLANWLQQWGSERRAGKQGRVR